MRGNVNSVYCFGSGARRAPFQTINLYFNLSIFWLEKYERFSPAPEGRPCSKTLHIGGIDLLRRNAVVVVVKMRDSVTETP